MAVDLRPAVHAHGVVLSQLIEQAQQEAYGTARTYGPPIVVGMKPELVPEKHRLDPPAAKVGKR